MSKTPKVMKTEKEEKKKDLSAQEKILVAQPRMNPKVTREPPTEDAQTEEMRLSPETIETLEIPSPMDMPRYSGVNPVDLFNFWLSWRKTIRQGVHPLEIPYNTLPKEVRDKFMVTAVELFHWLDNYEV